MVKSGNSLKGTKNHNSKLNEHMVIIIRKLLSEKELTPEQIGYIFNVNRTTINDIKFDRTWGWLN